MKELVTRLWRASLQYWRESSRLQKVMFVSGTGLLASMVGHGVALAVSGGPIDGPVSFRKAMTFAETGWLLCWSVGWLLPLVKMRRWEQWAVASGALLFGVGETFLMSLQVWRGQPSHYNTTTPLNAMLFSATGVIALVFLSSMLVLLWAAVRERDLAPSLLLSIRAGTVLVLTGVATGILMLFNSSGVWRGLDHLLSVRFDFHVAAGAVGGDLVALHAIGVHGLSLVPLAAWLLTYSPLPEGARYRLTAWVAGSTFALMASLGVQVFRALPFSAFGPIAVFLLAGAGLALATGYAFSGWWALRGLFPAPGRQPA